MTEYANVRHDSCGVFFEIRDQVQGFATIPAKRERLVCPECGLIIDWYMWWPEIRGRRNCAILVELGRTHGERISDRSVLGRDRYGE